MANGDIERLDYHSMHVKLLDGQTASSNGVWVEIPAHYNIRSFHATALEEGASDATIDIHVLNDVTKPSDATAGTIGQTLSTPNNQAVTVIESWRWVKAAKTAGTTPVATTVVLVAGRQ